jgi:hypothetical protein
VPSDPLPADGPADPADASGSNPGLAEVDALIGSLLA